MQILENFEKQCPFWPNWPCPVILEYALAIIEGGGVGGGGGSPTHTQR